MATRSDLPPPTIEIMDVELSDHHLLQWSVPSARLLFLSTSNVERRLWKSLDIGKFQSEVSLLALCQPDVWQGLDEDDLAELYNKEVNVILNRQLYQLVQSSISLGCLIRGSMQSVGLGVQLDVWNVRLPLQPLLPRIKTRWLRLPPWRQGALSADHTENLRDQKREEFWTRTVVDNRSSPRELWRSVNRLLGRDQVNADDDNRSEQFFR